MVEIRPHQDIIKTSYTLVDNVFFASFLTKADAVDVKVYLYGWYLISTYGKADLADMALQLKIDEERIKTAYLYWEKQGLVQITRTEPVSLIYINPKNPMPKIANFDVEKYADFREEVDRLFPSRLATPNELGCYYELIEFSGIEPNALLLIMQYCKKIKDDKVGAPYILAVANNWIAEGYRTHEEVTKKIEQLETNSEDVRKIYETLGLKSAVDIDARQLYQSWLDMGYTLDSILTAARLNKKKGGMAKLDALIKDLQKAGAYNPFEIEEYGKKQKALHTIALGVVKGIGAYYGSLDVVIDTYVRTWVSDMGYSEDALLTIAQHCFVSSIKTLDGYNEAVKMFYKLGCVTKDAIESYIAKKIATDEEIKDVLEAIGSPRYVSAKDRSFYTTWTQDWGVSYDLITLAAEYAKGKNFAMSHVNRLLSLVKTNPNISTEEARKIFASSSDDNGNKQPKKKEMLRREYTKEELSSIFSDLNADEV